MATEKKKICGIVMPISECDGRPESHWLDVLSILKDAAQEEGFQTRLVSDTFESNLIHKEILQNIYHDDMIICDVSGRNPNVFFELGIRMATQKPTIIVKDDKTAYPFDTGPNRYVGYPRDLRHPKMEEFKAELKRSLQKTALQTSESSFIGQLGPFQIPDVENTTLPASDIILSRLERIERQIMHSQTGLHEPSKRKRDPLLGPTFYVSRNEQNSMSMFVSGISEEQIDNGVNDFLQLQTNRDLEINVDHTDPRNVEITAAGSSVSINGFESALQDAIENAIPF